MGYIGLKLLDILGRNYTIDCEKLWDIVTKIMGHIRLKLWDIFSKNYRIYIEKNYAIYYDIHWAKTMGFIW